MIHNYVQTINEVVIGPAGSREMGYLGTWQVLNMHAVHYLNFKYVLPDGPISTSNNKPHADPTSGFGHETLSSHTFSTSMSSCSSLVLHGDTGVALVYT